MPVRLLCIMFLIAASETSMAQEIYREPFRPQVHFSPKAHWMNDPNGLIYFKGNYHLFFQYYPDSTVWGPMHWGHAISTDLLHWKEQPIALFPDSLGYIFSGSAIADSLNTSGFGSNGAIPLIAVFTQHDPAGEQAGTNHFQNQGIAFSLDAGLHWTKYPGNPVLRTPGLKDFRDPKVMWYPPDKKWIMTLAAGDRILFYSSANLKAWNQESEFGAGIGAHGGVWECPDLLPFLVDGKRIWLLIVSINPGGIQGGSGTQYFVGDFDGKKFTPGDTSTRWMDYGADDYAGVTFSNTGKTKIFMGWMSNWQYATKVPTLKWRSTMTIPRILGLKKIGQKYFTTMMPVSLAAISESIKISSQQIHLDGPSRMDFTCSAGNSFSLTFSNDQGQALVFGFDKGKNAFYIDRRKAGRSDFYPSFAAVHYAPRIADSKESAISLILDNTSLEIFADQGLTTMTDIFFPDQPLNDCHIETDSGKAGNLTVTKLKSIWH
jgi:fructan beta-fructosidase